MLYNWATVTLREFHYEVYITFFLHTAGISTVSHARDKTKTSLTKMYLLFILVNQENWRWHGLAIRVGIEIALSLSIIDRFVSAAVRLNLRHRCGWISMGHCRRSMVASCYWSVFRAPIGAHSSSLVIKDKQCSSWNVRSSLNLDINNFTKNWIKTVYFPFICSEINTKIELIWLTLGWTV